MQLVGLGPKFMDSKSQTSLDESLRNLPTSFMWGQTLKLKGNFKHFADHRQWELGSA